MHKPHAWAVSTPTLVHVYCVVYTVHVLYSTSSNRKQRSLFFQNIVSDLSHREHFFGNVFPTCPCSVVACGAAKSYQIRGKVYPFFSLTLVVFLACMTMVVLSAGLDPIPPPPPPPVAALPPPPPPEMLGLCLRLSISSTSAACATTSWEDGTRSGRKSEQCFSVRSKDLSSNHICNHIFKTPRVALTRFFSSKRARRMIAEGTINHGGWRRRQRLASSPFLSSAAGTKVENYSSPLTAFLVLPTMSTDSAR